MLWHAIRFDASALTERDALSHWASWAMSFTPAVSLEPPAGLLLDTGPSLRYFGGLDAFESRLRQGLDGHPASIASAPTPGAASLLARWRDGARCTELADLPACVGRLPVGLLAAAQDHLDALESAGLRRISALLALPRAGLARRFGQELLDELDRALGRLPDPRPRHAPPPAFDMRLELPARVDSAQALDWAAGRLVERLCEWLQASRKAARRFELAIRHDDGSPDTVVAPGLAEPAWHADRLRPLLRERLAALKLPAPATALRLRCREIDAAAAESGQLFPDPASVAGTLAPLIERLQARLGHQRVQRLQPLPDHRPEAAWQACEVDLARLRRRPEASARRPRCAAENPVQADEPAARFAALPRPLWLLDSPVAIGERNGRPFRDGPLSLLAGPERIESGWWEDRSVQRDYFVAEDSLHRLLWIYRERLRDDATGGWFLHGRFG